MDINLATKIGEHNAIEVEARYTKGGHNYFRGGNDKRGIYLNVKGLEIKFCEATGFTSRSFMLFGSDDRDFSYLIVEMKRANKKSLAVINAAIDLVDKDKIVELYTAKDKKGIIDLVMVELIKAAAVKKAA